MTALRPTPPQPTTQTVSPLATCAVLRTAPTPVMTPQARRQASSGVSSGTGTICERCTSTWLAKAAVRSPCATGAPVASLSGVRSSRGKVARHDTGWPRRQARQVPQWRMRCTTTGVPTATGESMSPWSTTRPAASWPQTAGSALDQSPSTNDRSLWQIATASTATSTSSGPGARSSSCSIDSGVRTPRPTAAVINMPEQGVGHR